MIAFQLRIQPDKKRKRADLDPDGKEPFSLKIENKWLLDLLTSGQFLDNIDVDMEAEADWPPRFSSNLNEGTIARNDAQSRSPRPQSYDSFCSLSVDRGEPYTRIYLTSESKQFVEALALDGLLTYAVDGVTIKIVVGNCRDVPYVRGKLS